MKPELIALAAELRESHEKRSAYLDSIPRDINSAFFDNEHVELLESDLAALSKVVFGKYYGDIDWFIHEFKLGAKVWEADGTAHVFNTEADFFLYLEAL